MLILTCEYYAGEEILGVGTIEQCETAIKEYLAHSSLKKEMANRVDRFSFIVREWTEGMFYNGNWEVPVPSKFIAEYDGKGNLMLSSFAITMLEAKEQNGNLFWAL